jgi:putative ABC transport system ATP-binding protein
MQDNIQPIIEVRDLTYSYGSGELIRPVLKSVDLSLNAGEIVIMTGPSGSGKTTLLTIIGALRAAHEGSVKVFGRELIGANKNLITETRLKTGYIFQQHNLLKSLTALQNVCLALELRPQYNARQRKEMAENILKQVGLGDRMDYTPAKLSGGQKQRVSIARALVSNPQLILADEPTASLDKVSGQEAVNILKKLAKEQGTTILMVTHDYRILDMADRVIELEDGKIQPYKQPLS